MNIQKLVTRKRCLWAVLVVAVAFLFGPTTYVLVRYVFGPAVVERWGRLPFDSAVWKNDGRVYGGEAVRLKMVDNLLRRKLVVGKSRIEVESLLGEPMSRLEYKFYSADGFEKSIADHAMVYWLGPERGPVSFDSEWLVLIPDATGRISQQQVIHGGLQDIRNPSCEYPDGFQFVETDETRHRLFVESGNATEDELISNVIAIKYYVRKCKGWDKNWSVSYFTQQEFAGYKDSPKLSEAVRNGKWQASYLAEFDRKANTLTLHPAEPKAIKAVRVSLEQD